MSAVGSFTATTDHRQRRESSATFTVPVSIATKSQTSPQADEPSPDPKTRQSIPCIWKRTPHDPFAISTAKNVGRSTMHICNDANNTKREPRRGWQATTDAAQSAPVIGPRPTTGTWLVRPVISHTPPRLLFSLSPCPSFPRPLQSMRWIGLRRDSLLNLHRLEAGWWASKPAIGRPKPTVPILCA